MTGIPPKRENLTQKCIQGNHHVNQKVATYVSQGQRPRPDSSLIVLRIAFLDSDFWPPEL